jgi:glycerophosphoryl diester phosphodiesterase
MRHQIVTLSLALALSATAVGSAHSGDDRDEDHRGGDSSMQLGPRPFFLVSEMEDGRLKRQLQRCSAGPFRKSDFSIGHRGDPHCSFPSTPVL